MSTVDVLLEGGRIAALGVGAAQGLGADVQQLDAGQVADVAGEVPSWAVPADRLDALVQRRIAGGMDEWKAFQEACGELGGRVVEAGPESSCQR